MNAAIIGCGLIGQKRANALNGSRLVACADIDSARAHRLAGSFTGVEPSNDWHKVVTRQDVDIVIVATSHDRLAEITGASVEAGKHVLVEKPAAIHSSELDDIIRIAARNKVRVRVGFNHRYHRAFRKARELYEKGDLGDLMFLRARYGHGGRLGYENEWRAHKQISGGGELIDQGMHLIDLARWFLGDFVEVQGFAATYYWNMNVDDNSFLMLKTASKQVAFLHASCTEWKNLFSFEIYGKKGKLEISGLGGSYGVECLAFYRMLPEMGPPETTIWEYPMPDDSWSIEFEEFLQDIDLNREPAAGLIDAQKALRIVEQIYQVSGK
jgi:predicted dehydrogenase